MAKPPKGVVPPHLRKFLFKKGQKPPTKKGRAVSSTRAAAGKPAGGRMASAKAKYHGMMGKVSEWVGTEVRPLQMLFSAGFGYILPKLLDRVGAGQLIVKFTGG